VNPSRPLPRPRELATLAFLASALALSGCSGGEQFTNGCTADSQCPVGSACRIARGDAVGVCICRSDEACGVGEICNSQGICQKQSACRSNAECEAAKFCDLKSGECIDRRSCGTDVHCLPGTICDSVNAQCIPGCYDNGDCPLRSVCARQTGTELLGSCVAGRCDGKDFCDYGQFCTNGSCADATDPNFCKDCGQGNGCGDPNNFCLINSSYDPNRPENGGPSFCGVACDEELGGEDCPNGYQCGGVVLLTQDQCTQDAECGGGGRQCVLGEGDLRGFCTCVSNQDCAFDTAPPACLGTCGGLGLQPCQSDAECLTSCVFQCQNPQGQACTTDTDCQPLEICGNHLGNGTNVCVTNGQPCSSAADCLCNAGSCINSGRPCSTGAECNPPCEGGGCRLGAACAPSEGLLCPDVR